VSTQRCSTARMGVVFILDPRGGHSHGPQQVQVVIPWTPPCTRVMCVACGIVLVCVWCWVSVPGVRDVCIECDVLRACVVCVMHRWTACVRQSQSCYFQRALRAGAVSRFGLWLGGGSDWGPGPCQPAACSGSPRTLTAVPCVCRTAVLSEGPCAHP
jgi:hypothetical protein